jgi:hypothetical protein
LISPAPKRGFDSTNARSPIGLDGLDFRLVVGGLVALGAGAVTTWLSRRPALLPMDPGVAAVEAAPEPLLGAVPLEPPAELPAVAPVEPVGTGSLLDEPAAPLQAFRFVEPPPLDGPQQDGPPLD